MENHEIELDDKGRIRKNKRNLGLIFGKTNGYCIYCGEKLLPFSRWHIEHMLPTARDGQNVYENLWPTCSFCNLSKGKLLVDEYRTIIIERMLSALDSFEQSLTKLRNNERILQSLEDLRRVVQDHEVEFYLDTIIEDRDNE